MQLAVSLGSAETMLAGAASKTADKANEANQRRFMVVPPYSKLESISKVASGDADHHAPIRQSRLGRVPVRQHEARVSDGVVDEVQDRIGEAGGGVDDAGARATVMRDNIRNDDAVLYDMPCLESHRQQKEPQKSRARNNRRDIVSDDGHKQIER